MRGIGRVLGNTVKKRIILGRTAEDQPAPSLRAKYARYKQRKGAQPIRDWKLTGRTLRGLGVTRASDNRVEVGFNDPVAARRAAINNRRSRQFGLSPRDQQTIMPFLKNFIEVKKG